MQPIVGVVKHYDWGDREYLAKLLGHRPDGQPWAELWLGTHRSGPARLVDGTALSEVTGELPYLLKVLAAARPLSLQTHPNAEQAVAGFAAGRYVDDSAKPELLCALTEFEALCGLRPGDETVALLDTLGDGAAALRAIVADSGPGAALEALYTDALDPVTIIEACHHSTTPEARWVRRLDAMYPGQPSVAAALLLHLVHLKPGEAIGLGAGNLHAYLHGCGVELMAASDNVVRAGLTTKAVDVDEVLRIVDREPLSDPVLAIGRRYRLEGTGIELLRLDPGDGHRSRGHEVAVDLGGGCWYLAPETECTVAEVTFVVTTV
jgi:mannose-6-phosphate isomerase